MLEMFQALAPYFGGKRKLAKKIMRYAEGKRFIDAFMGGGSIALLAKAKGFQVAANDVAERSAIVGRALIENDEVFIEEEDVLRLFVPNAANRHYVRDHKANQFKAELCDFLDNARANIDEVNDPIKRAVMMLLWVRIIFYYRPMGTFTHIRAVEKIEDEQADTPILRSLQERYSQPLMAVVRDLAENINSGVFSNGLENEFHQKDVFEFLSQIEGDTVYLDPPYYGAQSYEYHYNVLDCMLAGKDLEPEHSVFSTKQVIGNTLKLFEASQHIPTWVLSVGQRVIDKKRYIDLMSEFRKVEDIPISHAHTFGYGYNEEAGKQEVLLVGRS